MVRRSLRHSNGQGGFLLEATCGTGVQARLIACSCLPEAWGLIHEWLLPTLDAGKTILMRPLETVQMYPGEGPKLLFSNVDGFVNIMRAVGIARI